MPYILFEIKRKKGRIHLEKKERRRKKAKK